ncbi:MAG: GAF domain-containing protein [Anaerolineae bacterium]|nr:GAF domain-containing protein [Anaerolineae bacterium]
MTSNHRNPRELQMALTSARQTLSLLRGQAKVGKVDASFFEQRLAAIEQVMDELNEERQHTGRQERYAKLYEVTRVIGASLDLQTVLDQVMDAIIELTGAERGFLMLLNDDSALVVRAARNFDQETLESSAFGYSRTVTHRVLESAQAIVTTNAQEDPRFSGQQSVVTQSLRSIMASPLRVRGSVIGVVYVDNRVRTGLFSDDDLDVLDTFAGQAAVAIDNARLFSATDQALGARVDELTTLQRMDRQLNETLDIRKVMEITLGWLARSCHAEFGTMALLDSEGATAVTMSYEAATGSFADNAAIALESEAVQQAIRSSKAVWQPLSQNNTDDGTSRFALPVARENRVIGVIALGSVDPGAFNTDARAMAERMVDRAAISIENARLYAAVRAANQAKSEFVSIVAHELKVPMTSISGYADLMAMVGPVTDRQTQFIGTIKNAVYKMKVLVSDLSDISRIETGNMRIDLSEVNLVEAINSSLESTMNEIEQRKHTLHLDAAPDLPLVKADKDRLVQILSNLTSNAYKYTPDGGQIWIQAERRGNEVAISVRDTGVGMNQDQIAKLGTKFWRADNGLQQSGTGLGFAITRHLIEVMHGNLSIESQPGVGSTFTFTLPVVR